VSEIRLKPSVQHVGIVVTDIDRAAAFYTEVLDATWMLRPMRLGSPDAGVFLGGPEELEADVAMLAIGDGMLELFSFPVEPVPEWLRPNGGYVPHIGFAVDDTAARCERALAAGGRRLWDGPRAWGNANAMYLEDPDGNTVELIDVDAPTLAEICIGFFPGSAP
jgi:catechol 2,3-dioxygenase-like lactoylglutathione lyase family enzyme